MKPKTKEEQDSILANNRLIAEFLGYEYVRVGYYGILESEDESGESEWQAKNREWLDEVGIENVGNYFVKVPEKEWIEEEDLNYDLDWNKLMEVWQVFVRLRFSNVKHQFEHSMYKSAIAHRMAYDTITETYSKLVQAINWYNSTKQ